MSSTSNLLQNLPSLASIVDRQPLTVDPDMLLIEVISLMSRAKGGNCLLPGAELAPDSAIPGTQSLYESVTPHQSAVLVLANERLAGIFTERDLVKLTASQRSLYGVKVGEVMCTRLQTLVLSDRHTVMSALTIFQQHQIRHLPIVNDLQQLIGIVTPEHIRQILQPVNLLKFRSVAEAMTSDVVCAVPTTTILQIAQMMTERNISSIVIVDSQQPLQPVGIITEQDIIQFQTLELKLEQVLAQTVMSSPLFCLQSKDSLWAAQQMMQTRNIRRVVITNDRGELEGILTQSNLLQLLDPLAMLSILNSLQLQLLERATELEQTNRELQAEVARREQVEAQLRRGSQTLTEKMTIEIDRSASLTEELHVKVAEQKSSDIALEASQQGISDFVENALIGMHWVNAEGNIVWTNQAELNMFGYDRAEYIGQPLINFHTDRAKIADLLRRVSHNESVKNCEAQVYRKDGSICEVSIDAHGFFKDGKFIHTRCFTRDISEQKKAEDSLRNSERKFRAIFDNTFQLMGLLDPTGTVIEINRTALDAVAVRLDDVVGQAFWTTPWWTHYPNVQVQLQQAIVQAATGQVVRFEAPSVLADGTHFWVDFSLSPIFDAAGRVVMLIPEGRDITDRKQLEQDRQRFLDIASDLQVIADRNGYYRWVSPMFEPILGWTRAEMTSRPWIEFVHPDDISPSVVEAASLFDGNATVRFENRYLHKDGSYRWLLWNAQPYPEEDSIYAVAVDITDRKAATQKIQEQAALLNIATDAIIVRDLDGRVQFWNNGAESIYEWTAAEAVGQKTMEMFYTDILPELPIAAQTVRQQGTWQGELHKLTKSGKEVIAESRWTLVRDEAGNPISILSVDTDITEKKSLEQQFLRAQRLESLGSLASGIAHDLNNVLTPIVGAAQLLPMTLPNLDDRSRRLLNMLVESSKRGSGLVKQILTFARGLDGERTTIQVRHILTELISVARQTFPKSIEIQVDNANKDLWLVNVDATQIHQVLMNLFVNARDALPNGGSLTASSENILIDADSVQIQLPVGAYILITIADTGMGMTSEILDRIFEPFFTTKQTGTGLGLSTVQGIVKAHGGAIEVESQIGRGTCFKVYLPALYVREAESSAATANLYDGKGHLVLVVDDEIAIREIVKVSLETYNYRVMLASDGIEATDLYAQNHRSIAIVLIDMMMPHLDTQSTILALQQIDPQVQIVVMSGSDLNLAAMVDTQQVSAFLTKPFATADMLQTLAEIQLT